MLQEGCGEESESESESLRVKDVRAGVGTGRSMGDGLESMLA